MRTFDLIRIEDVSGVSGTGKIAEGVVWTDDTVTLRWVTADPSIATFYSLAAVLRVHGHQGATVPIFHDPIVAAPVDGAIPDVMRRVADLIEQGMPYLTVHCNKYGTHAPVAIHVREDDWPAWVRSLGGSTDAAVHEPHGTATTQHRWMSPDAKVTCFCLTANPEGLT